MLLIIIMFPRKAEVGKETAKQRSRTPERWRRGNDRTLDHRARRPWIGRKRGEVGFHLTQFLSGREYFQA